jgi:hypothetical protein
MKYMEFRYKFTWNKQNPDHNVGPISIVQPNDQTVLMSQMENYYWTDGI